LEEGRGGGPLRAFAPDAATLRLVGEFDYADLDTFLAALAHVAAPPADLVVDLTDLVHLGSTGVRGLLLADQGRGRTTLRGAQPRVRRVLEVANTASLFTFEDER
jgi:anti-anti-sigma factor